MKKYLTKISSTPNPVTSFFIELSSFDKKFNQTKSGIKTYKIKNEVLIPRKPFKIVLGFRNSRSCIREFNQTKSPNMHKLRKNRLRNIKCTESEN